MRACAIFVLSAFVFLVLLCAGLILQAQDPPKLPPDNSPPPDLSQPPFAPTFVPRVAVQRVRTVQGISPALTSCPKGYTLKSVVYGTLPPQHRCVKGRNSCVMIWPLTGLGAVPGFPWYADLCDAGLVVTTRVTPVYPPGSIRNQEQGVVVLRIGNQPDGSIPIPTTLGGFSGPFRLEAAALAALRQWQWKPYLIKGHPALFWTRVYFKFELTPDGPRVQTFLRDPPNKSR